MRSYTVDQTAARQANANNYINESGKYIGNFTMVESIKSRNGTEGVEFSFKSNDGQQANYLTLWTYNEKGEALYGFKVLNAIMVCAGIQGIAPQTANITDAGGTNRAATIFPEFANRPIGLVLQKEFYIKQNGDEGFKFNILAPFQHHSELMAKEILDGVTTPKALGGIIATLKDKAAPAQQQRHPNIPNNYNAAKNGVSDPFGDDMYAGGF
ncbi:hypothetical protein E4695_08620 [Alcaligenaceae bacterium 429]|nr:hypothetical protein E4695_08620 [Alcaligenaceae bacterium 429]